jgi:3-hydroxypropanoate dehydrogenase
MATPLPITAQAQLFTEARSHHAWQPVSIEQSELRELYELMKWGPTSGNANPGRFVFVTTEEAKARLYSAVEPLNLEQIRSAPVTVIVAYDANFHDHVAKLFPSYDTTGIYAGDDELRRVTAFRNGTLQGAYALLAARTLGFDTCAMSGFDHTKLDEAFFAGTAWRSNFLFTLGHADPSGVYPRGPRLSFEEACRIQ